jgi:SAM-dependent methyltransferase
MTGSSYKSGKYWQQRSDMLYYSHVDYIVRTVGAQAQSLLDVGSGNCPYLEWFDWIGRRVSVDIREPYRSATVEGIQGDVREMDFGDGFDLVTCLQVLEHVPDAASLGRRLLQLGRVVVVSVPHKWSVDPPVPGHVHDPVDYEKLTGWMGREANYREIVREPFSGKSRGARLIAVYDADPARRFGQADIKARQQRRPNIG